MNGNLLAEASSRPTCASDPSPTRAQNVLAAVTLIAGAQAELVRADTME